MADIRLISILPVQGVQPSPISQGAGSQVPAIQINLPAGSILSGFIVNRDPSGNPVLRTESGDITFHSHIFLKIGSEVVIRLVGTAAAQEARILSIDGQPPPAQDAPPPPRGNTAPDVILSRTLAPPQATTETPPRTAPVISVTGTVVSSPPGNAAALPVGTSLALNIISLSAEPPPQPATHAAPAAPPPGAPALYAAYARHAAAPLPADAPLLPAAANPRAEGQPPAAAVKSPPIVTPPLTVSPAPVAAAPPPATTTVVATVIAREPSGETLVQTPLGTVRLATAAPLPLGGKVTLEIAQPPALPVAATPSATAAAAAAPLTEIAYQWSSLQQIAQLLSQRETAGTVFATPWLPAISTATSTSGAAITPREISSGLLFFVAALKGGNFRNWLGSDSVQWLQNNGHAALVRKAEAEFLGMARTFAEPPPGQPHQPWHTMILPFAAHGAWQQARIFIKHDRDPEKKRQGKKEGDTRFVIELTLTQLGEMQMDGFVRRKQETTEFDLFIRSLAPLSTEMQQDILRLYNDAGELTGYRGSLVFQAVREFPVHPMDEMAQHALHGVTA